MSALSVSTRREAGRAVVTLTGELDIATVDILRAEARSQLDVPDVTTLVLDLAGLTFLDSTGLGCWIELRNRAEQTGRTLALEAVPTATHRTLTIAGLAPLFGLAGLTREG